MKVKERNSKLVSHPSQWAAQCGGTLSPPQIHVPIERLNPDEVNKVKWMKSDVPDLGNVLGLAGRNVVHELAQHVHMQMSMFREPVVDERVCIEGLELECVGGHIDGVHSLIQRKQRKSKKGEGLIERLGEVGGEGTDISAEHGLRLEPLSDERLG